MPGPMRMMRTSGTKEKGDMKSFKKLLVYCKRYLPAIIVALILAVGGSVTTIIGPERIADLVNEITAPIQIGMMTGVFGDIDMGAVFNIGIILVAIYAAGAVMNYAQHFITASVTQYTAKRLRGDISAKINKLPLRYFDSTSKGDTLSRVTNDVDMISQTLASSVANLISSLVLFIGITVKMFMVNAVLAAVTIGTSVIGFVCMMVIVKTSQKYFNRKQRDLGVINGQIEEVYTNHNIVRAFGAKMQESVKYEKTNGKLYDSNWKSQCLSGMMMPIMAFVGNLTYVLIFVVGVSLAIGGSNAVTLGTIVSFVIYAKLFSQPLSTFAQSMTSIQQASAASKRVFELLEAEEMENEDGKDAALEAVSGNVQFKNVRFGYSPDKTIINNFSADLKKGQKVAIVGPTGAGKTTIVNLLMRFYDVDSGQILIDGVSTQDMKRENVHDLFDMILQDTWLFEGTIRENLVYNKQGVTDEDLDRACAAVGLKHFIQTMPQGYDTKLDESLNLSEGQKQQLTIARAMVKDAPLLILDEATSSVDTRTELVIQQAMDKLTEGRTSFVIAHRLSTVRNADVILVMRDGDIVEQGNHDVLLAKNGFYAELYNSQFATA